MSEYKIISHHNLQELEDRVNRYLELGWQPVGGIAIQEDGYIEELRWEGSLMKDKFYQAIFKQGGEE